MVIFHFIQYVFWYLKFQYVNVDPFLRYGGIYFVIITETSYYLFAHPNNSWIFSWKDHVTLSIFMSHGLHLG